MYLNLVRKKTVYMLYMFSMMKCSLLEAVWRSLCVSPEVGIMLAKVLLIQQYGGQGLPIFPITCQVISWFRIDGKKYSSKFKVHTFNLLLATMTSYTANIDGSHYTLSWATSILSLPDIMSRNINLNVILPSYSWWSKWVLPKRFHFTRNSVRIPRVLPPISKSIPQLSLLDLTVLTVLGDLHK